MKQWWQGVNNGICSASVPVGFSLMDCKLLFVFSLLIMIKGLLLCTGSYACYPDYCFQYLILSSCGVNVLTVEVDHT